MDRVTLTEKEFADAVGMCYNTVAELRRNRKIPYCREGRRIFYLPKHIDEYVQSREIRPKGNKYE